MKKLFILFVLLAFFYPQIAEACERVCVQVPFTEEEILASEITSSEQFNPFVFQVVAVTENGQSIIYMIHANEGVYRFAFFKGENLMDYGHCSLHKCWHNVSDTLDQGSIDYLKEKLKE